MLRLMTCLTLVACFALPALAQGQANTDDLTIIVASKQEPVIVQAQPKRVTEYRLATPPAQPVGGKPAAFLGVTTSQASVALSRQIDLPDGFGLVVDTVHTDSPAAEAGLERHDLLYKFEDQFLVNAPQLVTLVRSKKIGDTVELTVIRKGKHEKLAVAIGERPASLGAIDVHRIHAQPYSPIVPRPTDWHGALEAETMRKLAEHAGHGDPMTIQEQVRKAIERRQANPGIGIAPGVKMAVASSSQLNWSDNDHRINLFEKDGVKTLIVSTTNGDVIYDGPPPASQDDYDALPEDVRDKVRKVMGMTKNGRFFKARVLQASPIEVDVEVDADIEAP